MGDIFLRTINILTVSFERGSLLLVIVVANCLMRFRRSKCQSNSISLEVGRPIFGPSGNTFTTLCYVCVCVPKWRISRWQSFIFGELHWAPGGNRSFSDTVFLMPTVDISNTERSNWNEWGGRSEHNLVRDEIKTGRTTKTNAYGGISCSHTGVFLNKRNKHMLIKWTC